MERMKPKRKGSPAPAATKAVVASFETRTAYLEDARVADTALVLDVLARRRGIELDLPESDLLP